MPLFNAINIANNTENNVVNEAVNYAENDAVNYAVKKLYVLLPSNLSKDPFPVVYMRPSYWLQLERDTPHSQVRPISQSAQITTKCTYQECKPGLYFLYIIS